MVWIQVAKVLQSYLKIASPEILFGDSLSDPANDDTTPDHFS